MPHAFDTGATKAQRTRVRDAVIARLAPMLRSANPPRYIATIKALPKPYRGEGDVDGFDMLWITFNGQAPAIGVALGRLSFEPAGTAPTEASGMLEISIYAASQHSRDLVDGRLAADAIAQLALTADPGVETMLEHAAELLLGQRLDVDGVEELLPDDEDIVATFGDVTIGELKFKVQVSRDVNPARNTTQLVTSIENRLTSDEIHDGPYEYDANGVLITTNPHDPIATTVSTLDPPED